MSERTLNVRHSRVSPLPGRGSSIAYSSCPVSDPDIVNNVLAIPMSAINVSGMLISQQLHNFLINGSKLGPFSKHC